MPRRRAQEVRKTRYDDVERIVELVGLDANVGGLGEVEGLVELLRRHALRELEGRLKERGT